jgi:hypothetical protein
MQRFLALVILAVLGASLAACGTSAPPATIEYRRTGGIAGLDDHLTIQPGGQATLTRKNAQVSLTVDQATLTQLTSLLDQAGFSQLPAESLAPKGADLFTYEITYRGRRVRVQDTTVPAKLQPVIDLLNSIIQKSGQA